MTMTSQPHALAERALRAVDDLRDEIVALTVELVRIPTVNPPGENYRDGALAIGRHLERCGFGVEYIEANGLKEHTRQHPRVNVVGARAGTGRGPLVHINGHFDVVPAGEGWTVDPWAGTIKDGRIYGRGTGDMKAGIAAGLFAAEALRRAGIELPGSVELSGTVDEESGGFAGVAHLCEIGRIRKGRTDYVIIPEPLNVDRICLGHRGVYWFEVTTRGRVAHGSMPFLGRSAVESMATFLEVVRNELKPALFARRTAVPVVPDGARHATINVNALWGGQVDSEVQSPCVVDRCHAIFDRRFLVEEGFDATRAEIAALLQDMRRRFPEFEYELKDRMVVHPSAAPPDSPLVQALERSVMSVLGRSATHIASPGTYDQKHVARIGGLEHCVAYGPGILDLAHQPDEWCSIDDLVAATKVIALTLLDLNGMGER
jgi:succinyl-diaminopimelate desuccinylase